MLDRTVDEDGKYGSLVAHGLLMALVYIAATDIVSLLFLLLVHAGVVPETFHPWPDWSLVVIVSMILVGGIVIRIMRATKEECGLVFRKDEPYLLHALIIGVAAAMVRYAASMASHMVSNPIMSYFQRFGHREAPIVVLGHSALSVVYGIVQAFFLFGVMQAYLARKTSAHLRLGPWDIPVAGIVVVIITMIPDFSMLARQIISGYPLIAAMTLVSAVCSGVVTLASSYWFERSRSLTAPMIAFAATAGMMSIIHFAIYTVLR